MKIVSKYECEYCKKIYDKEISCLNHEKKHRRIEKFLIENISIDRNEIEIDYIDIIKNNRIFITKDMIFQNNKLDTSIPLVEYDRMIKEYKNPINDYKQVYLSASLSQDDILKPIFFEGCIADDSIYLQSGTFKNCDITNNRFFDFSINIKDNVSESEYKKILKIKLTGRMIRCLKLDHGKMFFHFENSDFCEVKLWQ